MVRGLACWLALLLLGNITAAAERTPKVLLIGIDGCRWDALEAANTPAIDRLIAAGTLSVGTEILAPRETPGDTVSGPGWSNLLCGVWPDKHGVVDNSFKGSNYTEYPHFFARIKGVAPKKITASFTDWGPIQSRILSKADLTVAEDAHGAAGYTQADAFLATTCAQYLKTRNPDAVMLYLGQVDETGHAKGFHPKVPEYIAAIERVDGHIGQVVAAIEARPTFAEEDWLILVGTDHGGVGTNHGGGRKIEEIRRTFLIVSGPSAIVQKLEGDGADAQTYQVDLVATALTHLRIPLNPDWKLDGRPIGLKP